MIVCKKKKKQIQFARLYFAKKNINTIYKMIVCKEVRHSLQEHEMQFVNLDDMSEI